MVQIWSEPLRKRYQSPIFSFSSFISVASFICLVIITFYIAYGANPDFWPREHFYSEQPIVLFQKRALVKLDLGTQGDFVTYSTLDQYNSLFGPEQLRVAQFRSAELDWNLDQRVDEFQLNVTFPIAANEDVHGVSAYLFFQASLTERVRTTIQAMVSFSASSAVATSGVVVKGDLLWRQRNPLSSYGVKRDYATSVLNPADIVSIEDVRFATLEEREFRRNDSLELRSPRVTWLSGSSDAFTFSASFMIPDRQTIRYIPTASAALHSGWVSFSAVFWVLAWLWALVMTFLFSSQLLQSRVRRDTTPPVKAHQF